MRIAVLSHMLHAIRSPYEGGLEMHTALTVKHLVSRGHHVTLYAREGSVTAAELVPVLPPRSEERPLASGDAAPSASAPQANVDEELTRGMTIACQQVLAGDVDVVLNNSLSPVPLRMLDGFPMVTVLHTPATLGPVLKVLDDSTWRAPRHHRWISVSASNALAWRHRLPHITVVPNGIELTDWHSTETPVPGRAVWTGRITPEKGLHLALDAAHMAGMELHFAGPVSDPVYYHEVIRPLCHPGDTYHGHLDHAALADLLASGEVFLSTPLWAEPFGLATVEAMAMGVPVAALLNGAMGEILDPAAGDLAVHHSAGALATSIQVARTRDRSRVSASAHRFRVDTMVEAYEGVLRDAMGLGSAFHPSEAPVPGLHRAARPVFHAPATAQVRSLS